MTGGIKPHVIAVETTAIAQGVRADLLVSMGNWALDAIGFRN